MPAWNAALEAARAHVARARHEAATAGAHFAAAAEGFQAAGQLLDAARCAELSTRGTADSAQINN